MGKFIDLVGNTYGLLRVEKRAENAGGRTAWNVVCQCEKKTRFAVTGNSLQRGNTKSCGCTRAISLAKLNKERRTHYQTRTRLYRLWGTIKARCNRETHSSYKNYGGRGIKVCEEWSRSFESFRDWAHDNGYYEDLGKSGRNKMTIERIDNNGDYEPSNCRWATNLEQMNNKRDNVYYTINNETKTLTEWSRITGVKSGTIYKRIRNGWLPERAITEPPQKRNFGKSA